MHIDQVHKLGTDKSVELSRVTSLASRPLARATRPLTPSLSSCGCRRIENALPGRESFDVEIYGMEGVPADALAAWKKKQAEEHGEPAVEHVKRPRYNFQPLSAVELRAQLAQHKALMSGTPLNAPGAATGGVVNGQPGAPPGPPPMAFGLMPPPPPGFSAPPPGFMPPPPGFIPPPFAGFPPG